MSIKDRFKMVMDREKLTAGAFAESIGVAQATILTSWVRVTNIQVRKSFSDCINDTTT